MEGGCLSCQRRSFMAIDGIRSPYRFEGIMRRVIYMFKYRHLKSLAHPLAQLMGEYLEVRSLPCEVLVPVPLHPRRLRQRGYNQSVLLVQELRRLSGLPLNKEALRRCKDTSSQVKSNHAEIRWSNVADAFECSSIGIEQRQILLIDDVCTTGATLDACAAALKRAGATSVWGLTVAMEV